MTRVYCGRVGAALVVPAGTRCPECGDTLHQELPDDGPCHAYARCHNLGHGHPCELPSGHGGEKGHACPAAQEECEIVKSKVLGAGL